MLGASMNVLDFITPALLTSRLTSAHSAATSATRCGSVMSSATGITPGSVTWAGRRAAPKTLVAPRLTSSRAYARPSPRLAPVTRATDPPISMAGQYLMIARRLGASLADPACHASDRHRVEITVALDHEGLEGEGDP